MPRPSTSGEATSSSQSAFRTGPGPTPSSEQKETEEEDKDKTPNVDWVKRKKPSNVKTYIYAAEDYAHQEQRIAFLRSGKEFVIFTVEGPHSTHVYGSNLVWKQYLRRLTFHAALSFNILTEGQLDAQMLNENDHEWLKLYHYLTTTTELVRCRGYPVTEVLAMLTLGIQDTVEGGLRRRLRSLSNQIGQFVAGRPWIESWDELGGQVRMNKCLILTDLTYQTKSTSKTTHDIEAGLNNMGVASIKVYQLPYESLEDPEAFLQIARNALNFLRYNADTLANITVHVWISFASLFRGQNRILVPEDDYAKNLAGIIEEISQYSPTPIFVNILKDARFFGSQSSIVSIAEEFAEILRNRGIMHSTHERFWKQIYACGSEPFYWRQGDGKEIIWAILEKSLMRQKVFLHCAMDHYMVHELNEECVHVKNTGFDLETIKRCTDHPGVIPNLRNRETADAQTGSADIIGGMKHTWRTQVREGHGRTSDGAYSPPNLWLTQMNTGLKWLNVPIWCVTLAKASSMVTLVWTLSPRIAQAVWTARAIGQDLELMALKSLVWTNSRKMLGLPPDSSISTIVALIGENFMQNGIWWNSWWQPYLRWSLDTRHQTTSWSKYLIEVPSACLHTWWRANADETYCPNSQSNGRHEVR